MPSLPTIEKDQVRHAKNAPDGGSFDAPVAGEHAAVRADYCMRLGDDALILGQRLSEWCGHAPVLEVDLSLANLGLDLIGQAAHSCSRGDADRLAFTATCSITRIDGSFGSPTRFRADDRAAISLLTWQQCCER